MFFSKLMPHDGNFFELFNEHANHILAAQEAFLKFIEKLRKQGKKVIFTGDINTAHNEIDLARPKENSQHTGFLRIERDWLDKVVNCGYLDTFRYLHTEAKYTYCSNFHKSREKNKGWRIDIILISDKDKIGTSDCLTEYFGSDHCTVLLELK